MFSKIQLMLAEKPNPHYDRLMQYHGRNFFEVSPFENSITLPIILMLCMLPWVAPIALFLFLALLPTVLGTSAALFTARDTSSPSYSLVTLILRK